MTPSERERRIEAAVRSWITETEAGDFMHSRMAAALDAADREVPMVSEAEYSAEVDARVRLSLDVTRDSWEAMQQRAESAEAAARELITTGEWAIQCLRDVVAQKPVRGLDEALSGWEHACASFSVEEAPA